jgi:hypothetical protein
MNNDVRRMLWLAAVSATGIVLLLLTVRVQF